MGDPTEGGWQIVTSRRKKAAANGLKLWALELEKSLHVQGLAATLCGPAFSKLTAKGWEFAGVVRGNALKTPGAGLSGEFQLTPIIGNHWNDQVLMRRQL